MTPDSRPWRLTRNMLFASGLAAWIVQNLLVVQWQQFTTRNFDNGQMFAWHGGKFGLFYVTMGQYCLLYALTITYGVTLILGALFHVALRRMASRNASEPPR